MGAIGDHERVHEVQSRTGDGRCRQQSGRGRAEGVGLGAGIGMGAAMANMITQAMQGGATARPSIASPKTPSTPTWRVDATVASPSQDRTRMTRIWRNGADERKSASFQSAIRVIRVLSTLFCE
jgi:hypothetical protein